MEDAALLLFLVVGVVTCALMTLHEPDVPGNGLSQTHWDGGHNLELTAVY